MANIILATVVLLSIGLGSVTVNGHGRLVQPAGRATLWRYQKFARFNPVANYDDTQLFCGGFQHQYEVNGGKCGICGDPYEEPQPRKHEGGGLYGRGIITGEYQSGSVIDVQVEITASHLGYFEFRLCPQNNPLVPATQECLDQYLLPLADGSGYRHPVPNFNKGMHNIRLRLPQNLTCRQCVLQWHYNTGNSHGQCENGSWEMGCGNQETFRGCADISIA